MTSNNQSYKLPFPPEQTLSSACHHQSNDMLETVKIKSATKAGVAGLSSMLRFTDSSKRSRTRRLGSSPLTGGKSELRANIDLAMMLFEQHEQQYGMKTTHQSEEVDGDNLDDALSTCSSLSSHDDDEDDDRNIHKVFQVSCRKDFLCEPKASRRKIFRTYWSVTGETPVDFKPNNAGSSLLRSKGMSQLTSKTSQMSLSSKSIPDSNISKPIPPSSPGSRRSIFGNESLSHNPTSELPSLQVSAMSYQSITVNTDKPVASHRLASPTRSCLKKDSDHSNHSNNETGKMTLTLNESDASLETALTSISCATRNSSASSVRFDAQVRVISFERSTEQNDNDDWMDHFTS